MPGIDDAEESHGEESVGISLSRASDQVWCLMLLVGHAIVIGCSSLLPETSKNL